MQTEHMHMDMPNGELAPEVACDGCAEGPLSLHHSSRVSLNRRSYFGASYGKSGDKREEQQSQDFFWVWKVENTAQREILRELQSRCSRDHQLSTELMESTICDFV